MNKEELNGKVLAEFERLFSYWRNNDSRGTEDEIVAFRAIALHWFDAGRRSVTKEVVGIVVENAHQLERSLCDDR